MDKKFENARSLAVKEAIRLNDEDGYYRWKTVTMNSDGVWFAHESKYVHTTYSYEKNSWIIPYGETIALNTPKFEMAYHEHAYVVNSLSIVNMMV